MEAETVEAEVFAAVCAVQSPADVDGRGSWTTGAGSGSDPDDI